MVRSVVGVVSLGVVTAAAQSTLAPGWAIGGGVPQLVAVVVVAAALTLEPDRAATVAFTVGLVTDLVGPPPAGTGALAAAVSAAVMAAVRTSLPEMPRPVRAAAAVVGCAVVPVIGVAAAVVFGQPGPATGELVGAAGATVVVGIVAVAPLAGVLSRWEEGSGPPASPLGRRAGRMGP